MAVPREHLERFRAGTLKTVTADEFRSAAFASHPKAYTEAGLTTVVLIAPELGRYIRESSGDPSLRGVFEEFDEDACTWSP